MWSTEIGNFRSFFALLPPSKSPKNQNFERWINLNKWKKSFEQITIIWWTVPELRNKTDRIFCFLSFWAIFRPFTNPTPPSSIPMIQWSWKSKFFKKILKMPGDMILLYIHVYHKWRSYNTWSLKYKVWQTEIFIILGHFFSFQPLDNLGNQNFNIEKTPGDIIILHICTINDNHMMYGSWDVECNRQNFLSS